MGKAAFFGGTYDEAMALLVEARTWIAHCEPRERSRLDPIERVRLSCETMRMTARLTQAMAWVMGQRAIHEGHMTADDLINRQIALGSLRICLDHAPATLDGMPSALVSLLDRSHRFYRRLARLDDQMRQRRPVAAPVPAVRRVLRRVS